MTSSVEHRKVELQEQDDLRYLISNVLRVANEHIDRDLPPMEGEDPYRPRVQELVQQYILQTFTLAGPSLLINGHSPSSALIQSLLNPDSSSNPSSTAIPAELTEYAPQNHKLIDRLKTLTDQSNTLNLEIAELRRTAPAKIVEANQATFASTSAQDDKLFNESKDLSAGDAKDVELGITALERQEDIEKAWGNGVEGLGALKRGMGGTAARMEGARRAGTWVLGSK